MEDNFNKHLGNKLKLRRLALGLTQTKVAKAINVTFQQIQKYEKGTNGVSSNRLMQLSQFLKVPIIYFFEDFKEFKDVSAVDNVIDIPIWIFTVCLLRLDTGYPMFIPSIDTGWSSLINLAYYSPLSQFCKIRPHSWCIG